MAGTSSMGEESFYSPTPFQILARPNVRDPVAEGVDGCVKISHLPTRDVRDEFFLPERNDDSNANELDESVKTVKEEVKKVLPTVEKKVVPPNVLDDHVELRLAGS